MKKYLQISMVVILCFFLASCKEQKSNNPLKNSISQTESDVPESFTPLEAADTIFSPNAPSGITRKIRIDKEGNVLFAAFTDVITYDGASFSKIPKPEGFESMDAFDALEDSKGNIWIASTRYGIFRYDGEDFTHFTTQDGLPHNRTMDIHEDKAGNIWIATMGGAGWYDGNSFQTLPLKEGFQNDDVNTIIEDLSGKLWFGTRGNAYSYDPSSSTLNEINTNMGRPLKNVRSILEDKKGDIWLSSNEGIWRYSGHSLTRMSNKGGNHIYQGKNGHIWFTSGNSLSFFSNESLVLSYPGVTQLFTGEGMFFGISEDKDGNIWVGTLQGVFTYDGKSIHHYKNMKL